MKKRNIIIAVLIAFLVLGALIFGTKLNGERIVGNSYRCGDLNEMKGQEQKILISDYQTFVKYFNENANFIYGLYGKIKSNYNQEILDTYSEEYFEEKQLGVVYQYASSGAIKVEYKKCKIKDNVAYITYDRITPSGMMTADSNGYFVIVELPKEVTSIETKMIEKIKWF
mgnify:CR=1 FL=1